jgi:hypothetical protein
MKLELDLSTEQLAVSNLDIWTTKLGDMQEPVSANLLTVIEKQHAVQALLAALSPNEGYYTSWSLDGRVSQLMMSIWKGYEVDAAYVPRGCRLRGILYGKGIGSFLICFFLLQELGTSDQSIQLLTQGHQHPDSPRQHHNSYRAVTHTTFFHRRPQMPFQCANNERGGAQGLYRYQLRSGLSRVS